MRVLIIVPVLFLMGCEAGVSALGGTPRSLGEKNSGFTYVPLDPLKVVYSSQCIPRQQNGYDRVLDFLPDNAVRIAVRELTSAGQASFGPAGLGISGNRYKVVLDHVNADTVNVPFFISARLVTGSNGETTTRYRVTRRSNRRPFGEEAARDSSETIFEGEFQIPVYVGVGLRLTADIDVIAGNVSLSSLPALAAKVEANQASGSLVVQTLGITGKQTSTGLPITSELNRTTVQNAVLSLGTIKAILYSDDAVVRPRVTGMYLPLRDGTDELVNLLVSELAKEPIEWIPGGCTNPGPPAITMG